MELPSHERGNPPGRDSLDVMPADTKRRMALKISQADFARSGSLYGILKSYSKQTKAMAGGERVAALFEVDCKQLAEKIKAYGVMFGLDGGEPRGTERRTT